MSKENNITENRHGVFVEQHRCSGDCCQLFNVHGKTINELREMLSKGNFAESEFQIPDMLIPLGYDEYVQKSKEMRHDNRQILSREEYNDNWFRCKNFDVENNLCLVYETRPDMCRTYPYCNGDKGCEYKNCTLKFEQVPQEKEVIHK